MARKSMNVVDVKAWINNNLKRLEGLRIANIYQVNDIVVIKFKSEERLLVVEGGRRVHLSRRMRPVETKTTPLIMILKKEIRDRRVENVEQINNDRIVKIGFSGGRSLVVELLPRGIIALIDDENKVIVASEYLRTKDRTIRRGSKYVPPPSASVNFSVLDPVKALNYIKKHKDLVRGLIRGLGVPGEVAEESVYRAGLSLDTLTNEIDENIMRKVINSINEIIIESLSGKGYLVLKDNAPIEASPFEPKRFKEVDEVLVKLYSDFDDALDDLFALMPDKKEESEYQKLLNSVKMAKEAAEKYKKEAERLRRLMEEVAVKYPYIEDIIKCVRNAFMEGGWREVTRCPKVTSISTSKGTYVISLNDLEVEVNIKEDVKDLIVRLHTKAGEMEAKARRALESITSIRTKLEEIEFKNRVKKMEEVVKLRKRKWYEKYHWLITRNGFLAIGGRNADQNESIVRKYLDDKDIFLHADVHGAPAVILKVEERSPELEDIIDAALISAVYSKAWREGLGSVDVWWVKGEQVSKSPPSGEYLPKGSFMIYGKKNYLRPIKLRLALGIGVDDEGIPMVIIGPEDLVVSRSLAYSVIVPGDEKVSEVSKRLRERLASVLPKEARHLVLALPIKEFEERVPGRSRILYVRKGKLH